LDDDHALRHARKLHDGAPLTRELGHTLEAG